MRRGFRCVPDTLGVSARATQWAYMKGTFHRKRCASTRYVAQRIMSSVSCPNSLELRHCHCSPLHSPSLSSSFQFPSQHGTQRVGECPFGARLSFAHGGDRDGSGHRIGPPRASELVPPAPLERTVPK